MKVLLSCLFSQDPHIKRREKQRREDHKTKKKEYKGKKTCERVNNRGTEKNRKRDVEREREKKRHYNSRDRSLLR